MKKILAFIISLALAVCTVYFSHRLSHERPQPQLYARTNLDVRNKEMSLTLTNIGKREILVPVGTFSIFTRQSSINKHAVVLHIRLELTDNNDETLSVLTIKPGDSTRIGGLYRFIGRLPADCEGLYSVFEVSDEVGEKLGAWHGLVRAFPVQLNPEKK